MTYHPARRCGVPGCRQDAMECRPAPWPDLEAHLAKLAREKKQKRIEDLKAELKQLEGEEEKP